MAPLHPPSALIGQPPLNEHDYYIVRGKIAMAGMLGKMDPAKGWPLSVPRPPPEQYVEDSLRTHEIVSTTVCIFLILLATGLRLAVRTWSKRLKLGWDDWFIIIGCFFSVADQALNYPLTIYGANGHHVYDVTYWNLNMSSVIGAGQVMAVFWSIGTVKLSVVCFYMRLSGFSSRAWSKFFWAFFWIIVAYIIACTICLVNLTNPSRAFWDLYYAGHLNENPKIIRVDVAIAALGAIEATADVALMIVPVVMLWKAKLRFSTKLRVWLAGFVGIGNIITAIGRVARNFDPPAKDFTYASPKEDAWAQAEITLGCITASLPVLGTLVTKLFTFMTNESETPRSQRHGRYVFKSSHKHGFAVRRPQNPDSLNLSWTETSTSDGTSHSGSTNRDVQGSRYEEDRYDDTKGVNAAERPGEHEQSPGSESGNKDENGAVA